MQSNDIFRDGEVKQYLDYFLQRFVIVPVDKASNNFAIICKTFYLKVLMKELGVTADKVSGNKVYKHVKISPKYFFCQQEKANKDFNNILEEENKRIPLLYWTSKQHKSPYKFRFIAGASHCYNKSISIEISLALKTIKNHFKNYCAVIKKNSGLSYFWSIDNSIEFLSKLDHIKKLIPLKRMIFLRFTLICHSIIFMIVWKS
jgi:hypothetical protein